MRHSMRHSMPATTSIGPIPPAYTSGTSRFVEPQAISAMRATCAVETRSQKAFLTPTPPQGSQDPDAASWRLSTVGYLDDDQTAPMTQIWCRANVPGSARRALDWSDPPEDPTTGRRSPCRPLGHSEAGHPSTRRNWRLHT